MNPVHELEGGEENPASAFGENRYLEKKTQIQKGKDATITIDDVGAAMKDFRQNIGTEVKDVLEAVKDVITPEFLLRMQRKKGHVRRIAASEGMIGELQGQVLTTIDEDLENAEREKKFSKIRRKRIKQKRTIEEVQGEAVKEAKKVHALQDYASIRDRMRRQNAERKEREESKIRKQKAEQEVEAQKVRDFRVQHWSEQSKVLDEEARHHRALREQAVKDNHHDVVKSTYNEWEDRDVQRARQQAGLRDRADPTVELPSGLSLGVFGRSQSMPSVREAPSMSNINSVHNFPSGPKTEYEVVSMRNMDTEAELAREQNLYDALTRDVKHTEQALDRLCQLRNDAERDLKQVNSELSVMYREQSMFPKRLPNSNEIATTAVRKNRINQLQKKAVEFQHCIDVSTVKKHSMEAQLLALAKSLAIKKDQKKNLDQQMKSYNNDLEVLPVVVGRSLSKVPGMEDIANPLEKFNAITQQSKYVTFKALGDMAQKAHKDSDAVDRDLWVARMGKREAVGEVDRTINRLANISERLKGFRAESSKTKIIEALKLFIKSETPLFRVDHKYAGPICWWTCRRPKMTKNINPFVEKNAGSLGGLTFDVELEEDESDPTAAAGAILDSEKIPKCVTLNDSFEGTIGGVVEFPKLASWSVMFNISVRGRGAQYESKDPEDYCKVKLGVSLSTLKDVGKYYYKINPDTGAVLYDIRFMVFGSSMAYQFDFLSTVADERKHLAVGVGQYEEYQPPELEIVSDMSHPEREKVISSYVRQLKLAHDQGGHRMTELLIELIGAEDIKDYKGKSWDSAVIQNYPQRYEYEYFLRILRAEILTERNNMKRELALLKQGIGDDRTVASIDLAPALQMKLMESKERFLNRKRRGQVHRVEQAKKKVGNYVEIYDPAREIWRHVLVTECRIKWVEAGMVAFIRHTVQELDDIRRPIGGLFEVDLESVRALDSPIQRGAEEDDEALRVFEAHQKWNQQITLLDQYSSDDISRKRKEYVELLNKEEEDFEEYKLKSFEDYQRRIDDVALAAVQEPYAQRTIDSTIQEVISEIKVGYIERDEEKTLQLQAREEATQRFINNFKAVKMEELEKKHLRKEAKLREKMENKLNDLRAEEKNVIAEAKIEKRKVEKLIKKQRRATQEAVMKKISFPPGAFEKCIPKSDICEHVKAKAWGDLYSNGVRCLSCGKELSEIHMEESQVLGYGSGAEPWLCDAVNRHRENPASFRFKTSKELKRVEMERRRLEKERYELDEREAYFYDYQDITAVYEFDRRHAPLLKTQGAFRQGVQWNEEDIRKFEEYEEMKERIRLAGLGITVPEKLIDFDPLDVVENPPPTFRAEDEKHKSEYHNFMHTIGRIKNFRSKIIDLKHERMELMMERTIFSTVLGWFHKESFLNEVEFDRLERDLDRTGRMLQIYDYMEKLWQKASKVLAEAQREQKRAEMRRCGLWESVREAREELVVVRDQTRELLKLKYTYESQLNATEEDLTRRRLVLLQARQDWDKYSNEAVIMLYCMPGESVLTPYGWASVVQCRFPDQMLFVTLEFGWPRARAWIRADVVINEARSREKAEIMIMGLEDAERQKFYVQERIQVKKELYYMRREEERTRICFKAIDLGVHEKKITDKTITLHVQDAYMVSRSEQYVKAQKKAVEKEVTDEIKKRNIEIAVYTGPKASKPKSISIFKRYDMRKRLVAELNQEFFIKAAKTAKKIAGQALKEDRVAVIREQCLDIIMREEVASMFYEIATEAIEEGKAAKVSAEQISGIYFANPAGMQYSSYCHLRNIWKDRKRELKLNIQLLQNAQSQTKIVQNDEDLSSEEKTARAKQKLEEEAYRRAEEKRQRRLCEEMHAEEIACREFYAWELKINLQERKMMRLEESVMKTYLKELAKMKAAEKSAYNVSHAKGAANKVYSGVTEFERKRQELKDLALERRFIADELARMTVEDELSQAFREIDRAERARDSFLEQMGGETDENLNATAPSAKPVVDINNPPEWMVLPTDWQRMNRLLKESYMYKKFQLRIHQGNIQRQIDIHHKILDRAEAKSFKEWTERYNSLRIRDMQAELSTLLAEEECKESESILNSLRENIRKLGVFCQQKGMEELRANSSVRDQEEVARRRDKEFKSASDWVAVCLHRSKQRAKVKRRVEADCKWIDTNVINGFQQRFRTELLRKRLYRDFFIQVIALITNRAEIIATERRLMKIMEKLSVNRHTLVHKIAKMKEIWQEYRRDTYMRTRRSELNKKFFPHTRKQVLQQRFIGWVRYFFWNRGNREAFELKYELLKRQMDIDRQFKEQLITNRAKRVNAENLKVSNGNGKRDAEVTAAPTLMERHRARAVECKNCKQLYLESQNTSMSCQYHPMKYTSECPKSCPNPGLTALCISHRKKRWPCCDKGQENISGCARRYHIPVDSDPIYDKVMAKVIERDQDNLNELDEKLDEIRKGNWPQKAQELKRNLVFKVEDELEGYRKVAQKAKDLKYF